MIPLLLCLLHIHAHAQGKTDSLLGVVKLQHTDTSTVNALASLSKVYALNDPKKAMSYAEHGQQLAENIGYKRGMALCFKRCGNICYYLNQYDKALENYKKALLIYSELNDRSSYGTCLNNIGNIYFYQSNFSVAMTYYQSAIKICEAIPDKKGMSLCYLNIGNIYCMQGDYEKGVGFYQKSINLCAETGDKNNMLQCLNNVGNIYLRQTNYNKSIEYYQRSLEIAQSMNDKTDEARAYNNIGLAQLGQGIYPSALDNISKSLKIREEIGDKQGIANIYINLSDYYNQQKNYTEAINYAEKALSLATEIGSPDQEQSAQQTLSESYKGMGNYKEALHHYELFKQLNDTIYNTEKSKQLAKMEAAYHHDTEQKEIEIQKIKLSQQELKLDSSHKWLIIIVLLSLLIIIFFSGFILFYKAKQKAQMKTEMLRQQEIMTNAIIETQEGERKRIAQDLHDGIGHKLTTIKINFENIKSNIQTVTPENIAVFEQTSEILDETHKEVRALSHQMMPKALQEKEFTFAVSDLLEQTISNSGIKYKLSNNVPNELPLNICICLYRVLQELLNNILKYAQAKEISVQIFKNTDTVIMMVEDDGIGIGETEIAAGGIGLKNISGRIHALNGTFVIEKGPYKGTIATARIPLSPVTDMKS